MRQEIHISFLLKLKVIQLYCEIFYYLTASNVFTKSCCNIVTHGSVKFILEKKTRHCTRTCVILAWNAIVFIINSMKLIYFRNVYLAKRIREMTHKLLISTRYRLLSFEQKFHTKLCRNIGITVHHILVISDVFINL